MLKGINDTEDCAKQLVKLMANNDLGACAYANLEDVIKSQ